MYDLLISICVTFNFIWLLDFFFPLIILAFSPFKTLYIYAKSIDILGWIGVSKLAQRESEIAVGTQLTPKRRVGCNCLTSLCPFWDTKTKQVEFPPSKAQHFVFFLLTTLPWCSCVKHSHLKGYRASHTLVQASFSGTARASHSLGESSACSDLVWLSVPEAHDIVGSEHPLHGYICENQAKTIEKGYRWHGTDSATAISRTEMGIIWNSRCCGHGQKAWWGAWWDWLNWTGWPWLGKEKVKECGRGQSEMHVCSLPSPQTMSEMTTPPGVV